MINNEKLEEILVKNWTGFLDTKKMMLRVLLDTSASSATFTIDDSSDLLEKTSVRISVSRFQLVPGGFIVWIEFVLPGVKCIVVGTAEYLLSNSDMILKQIIGTKFMSKI